MIDGLKPYPAYKDSGVEWLGDIPKGWEVRKLRHILSPTSVRNRVDLPLLSVVREKGVILRNTEDITENHNYIPDDLSNYKVVDAGQFVVNKMKSWQGSYGVSPCDGIVSPAYFTFTIQDLNEHFFHQAIRSRAYIGEFTKASDGVRIGQWDLNQSRMKEIPFSSPPLTEQTAIIRFLNHADRRIKRFIRTKQKLIKLLEEQKQVMIHRAVTGQIDVRTGKPYPAYKDSGVEWLGMVPEEWEVARLRQVIVAGPTNGISPPPKNDDDGLKSFSISALRQGKLTILKKDEKVVEIPGNFLPIEKYALYENDVLIVRGSGNVRLVGKAGIVTENMPDYIYPDLIMRIRIGTEVAPQFIVEAINDIATKRQVEELARTTVGTFKINNQQLKQLYFAKPPLTLQRVILHCIQSRSESLNQSIAQTKREIELIREYHARLISDVVTGKLDVREAAAKLPDEADELESPDEADPLEDEDLFEGVEPDAEFAEESA